ncbi:AgmX/PglI C-terminal domain-containing protein [Nannocystis bainbridge]|uniref:AgmX/PglI C-terminal domain-containing protein n=1 Tax=Nannocystis bainbridge TaxID=2995303 RepID=A0ABT5DRW4_9BACT|nr:AgmX/PglI C-terminal domain-containing protein [Nannocystis bainbridge]MDC0716397.1 AgmX/PglI C-terminal domain-containing protein [Nannocystis bainbridge]
MPRSSRLALVLAARLGSALAFSLAACRPAESAAPPSPAPEPPAAAAPASATPPGQAASPESPPATSAPADATSSAAPSRPAGAAPSASSSTGSLPSADPGAADPLRSSGHFVATDSPAGSWRTDLPGSLDKDVVRRVVRSGIAGVRDCYTAGLAHTPTLAGRVTIQFTIGGDGVVKLAVVQDSTLPAAGQAVAECIAGVAAGWRFPPPEGGGIVIVSYPFVLEPE